uniref:Peptide ABC transporter substrate-binding protein n=1 Tax=Thermosporothrix sp. COM3 TaxID=2490863 RepID=A0A455SET8_9CHLR|nr:peptide ABC transporter substrate-binding protein [Thermosporothrix sp. COM3]
MALRPFSRVKGKVQLTLLSLLALLVVLSACQSGGSQGQNPQQQNKQTTLNILASPTGNFSSANFNPYISPNAGGMYGAQGMIYETLIYVNRYNGEIKPILASDYKLSDDVKSITFTIRQGVKWSDGQPFSADDVKFTLDMLKKYPATDTSGLWTTLIQDYAQPDANTIKVNFKNADATATWLFSQTYIVPKHIWEAKSNPATDKNEKPVGTGPYTLKEFSPSAYTLVKNPNYWESGKPEIAQLRYIATNDNTAAMLRLSRGEIDWAGVGWDPKFDANFVNKDPKNYHHWFESNNTVMLYLNLTKFPFDIPEVRQAISTAINREEIKQKAAPYGVPANPTGLLPAHKDWIAPEYQNASFTHDTAKATQLLEKAGFTKGSDGIYQKDGKRLSFNMNVPNGWADWQSALAVISDNLKAAGIEAKPNAMASPEIYSNALNTGNYDTAISWTNKGPSPFFFLNDWLLSSNTWDQGKAANGGATNWQHWKDSETDNLLHQYRTTSDKEAQKKALYGIQKIVVEKLPSIPLYYNVSWFEYSTKNATGWPDKDNPYAYGSPFDAPDCTQIVLRLKPAA